MDNFAAIGAVGIGVLAVEKLYVHASLKVVNTL